MTERRGQAVGGKRRGCSLYHLRRGRKKGYIRLVLSLRGTVDSICMLVLDWHLRLEEKLSYMDGCHFALVHSHGLSIPLATASIMAADTTNGTC